MLLLYQPEIRLVAETNDKACVSRTISIGVHVAINKGSVRHCKVNLNESGKQKIYSKIVLEIPGYGSRQIEVYI